MTPTDFATDPTIGAELDAQARRDRDEKRARAEALASRRPQPRPTARNPFAEGVLERILRDRQVRR